MNIFDLLEINPTTDLKKVENARRKKAAKLHPNKVEGEANKKIATKEFQEFHQEYEKEYKLIDSEEKLKKYLISNQLLTKEASTSLLIKEMNNPGLAYCGLTRFHFLDIQKVKFLIMLKINMIIRSYTI